MSGEEMRSIGCGPIGAFFSSAVASLWFNWQVKHWSHWIPTRFGEKEKTQLLKEYKKTNRIARVFGLAGVFTMSFYYRKQNEMTGSDWRGIGIAVGLMAFLPVAYIVAANLVHGTERVKEALTAFLIYERTPPKVIFTLIGICFITGLICAVSVVLRP